MKKIFEIEWDDNNEMIGTIDSETVTDLLIDWYWSKQIKVTELPDNEGEFCDCPDYRPKLSGDLCYPLLNVCRKCGKTISQQAMSDYIDRTQPKSYKWVHGYSMLEPTPQQDTEYCSCEEDDMKLDGSCRKCKKQVEITPERVHKLVDKQTMPQQEGEYCSCVYTHSHYQKEGKVYCSGCDNIVEGEKAKPPQQDRIEPIDESIWVEDSRVEKLWRLRDKFNEMAKQINHINRGRVDE